MCIRDRLNGWLNDDAVGDVQTLFNVAPITRALYDGSPYSYTFSKKRDKSRSYIQNGIVHNYKEVKEYYNAIKIFPQRLVIHKSSNYSEEEIDGFKRVASDMNINSIDLVTIMPTNFRLYRDNDYPPLRGTMFSLDKCRHFLYTRGYVEYYGTYPGKYIPNPIEVRLFSFDESPEQICKEILSLTKMNWNNTQFDRKFPITIECSRNVGEILKYVPTDLKPQIKYSFYM